MQILSLVIRQEAERQQMVRCDRAVKLEKQCESGRQEGNSHLEGELGRTARGDGTQRAPEVDGGREGTRRQ